MKKILIIGGVVLGIILLFVMVLIGANNRAIHLEEQIKESKASINVQEKRRADLILSLVDTVESYNKHEQDTLLLVIEARTMATNGHIDDAQTAITAIAEQYPELKASENYKQLMTELSVTENLIAEHRNNYNIQVKDYNKYVRKFPTSVFLNILGYERISTDYLEFDTTDYTPGKLFNN